MIITLVKWLCQGMYGMELVLLLCVICIPCYPLTLLCINSADIISSFLLKSFSFTKHLAPKSREELTLKISCDKEGRLKIGAHAVPVIYGFHKA